MPGLLVVEPSSTLSNLLVRTLRAGGYAATTVTHDYGEAQTLIEEALAGGRPHDAVIVGVPPRDADDVKPILAFLRDGTAARLPLLLVIHDKHPVLERWSERRGFAEIVPWQRFSRIPGILKQMIPEGTPEAEADEAAETGAVRILFIDDSQSARYAYRQLLEAQGFAVQVAASIEEGHKRALSQPFDLIIVDYYLPDGTGDQLVRALGNEPSTAGTTRAIITGSYKETIVKQCLDAGAVDCMFKNEAKELFVTRVSAMVRAIEASKGVDTERQRMDGILGAVGDGVYGIDNKGRVTFINPKAAGMLGHEDPAPMLGRDAREVFHFGGDNGTGDPILESAYVSDEGLSGHETVFRHEARGALPVELSLFTLTAQGTRQGGVVVFRDISDRKDAEQLRWEVSHDTLTGLSNRRLFAQHVDDELRRLRSGNDTRALLLIDIDRFGDIVEAIGASEGDRLLAEAAGKLGGRLRDSDLLARLEADKFALLLGSVQLPNLFSIADAFRTVVAEVSYPFQGITRPLTASTGVVVLSRRTPSAEVALEQARVACETAKGRGRNQTHIHIDAAETAIARELEAGWAERFSEAVEKDRFVFLAQPIVLADTLPGGEREVLEPADEAHAQEDSELIFELLLRMVSRDGQWIPPSVFVPLAERVNRIQEVDLWVVRKALDRLEQLRHSEYSVCLTLNLSNVTLQDAEALNQIRDVIEARSGLDPRRLIFEITECAEMADLSAVQRFMDDLGKLGCRFILDDFGTGFDSFTHLKQLPVDFIKIDGQYVQSMTSNPVDRTLVSSITSMAEAIGLKTIAEHVEDEATLAAIQETGVDYVQGYYLGEPELLDNLDLEGQFG